jgi:hypothetical protein
MRRSLSQLLTSKSFVSKERFIFLEFPLNFMKHRLRAREVFLIIIILLIILTLLPFLLGEDVTYKPIIKEPSRFIIRDVDLKPLKVTTSRVTFAAILLIDHYGNTSDDATLILKVIDRETGLLENEVTKELPVVTGEKTIEVSQEISVKREGGYEIKSIIMDRGKIVESGSVYIGGLEALVPEIRNVGLKVTEMDFSIENITGDTITVTVSLYLENIKDEPSPNLSILIKARQAESNLIADSVWISSGVVKPESTVVKSGTIYVPEGYNYVIEALIWNGDILIGEYNKALTLAPTKAIPEGIEVQPINIEVSKFIRPTPIPSPVPPPESIGFKSEMEYGPTLVPKTPGFTGVVTVGAIIMILLMGRRRFL